MGPCSPAALQRSPTVGVALVHRALHALPGTRAPLVAGHRGMGPYGVPTPYPLQRYGVRGPRLLACLPCLP